jgi:hypothetical protein
MASAARRPEGFVRSNRREAAQTRDPPSGLSPDVGSCLATSGRVARDLEMLSTEQPVPDLCTGGRPSIPNRLEIPFSIPIFECLQVN